MKAIFAAAAILLFISCGQKRTIPELSLPQSVEVPVVNDLAPLLSKEAQK